MTSGSGMTELVEDSPWIVTDDHGVTDSKYHR